MPFTLSLATSADAPAIANVLVLATADVPLSKLAYGAADHDAYAAKALKGIEDDLSRSLAASGEATSPASLVRYVKVTGRETGDLMAFAKWVLPEQETQHHRVQIEKLATEKSNKTKQADWPQGTNVALIEEFAAKIEDLRSRCLKGRRHYLLGNLATHPTYQRKGAASALVKWPFEEADRDDVIIYLDTAANGMAYHMYEKLGFREMGSMSIDLTKFGGVGMHTHVGMIRQR